MDITQASIIHHIGIVLLVLWILTWIGWAHPVVFFISLIYLYMVNENYSLRLRRRLQFEERKSANQRRLLSDSETVRWLNHAVEKIWPICMEQIASQQFLLPVIPWFLEKFKPWAAKEAVVQHLYLGRRAPMFTEIRVLGESADDDHLVLELGMNFVSADDLSVILAVKPRLGLGIWASMHVTGMHVEGKVLVGVKFLRNWPFLSRVRVCFVQPPYFQMTVKPIINHGVDVTELPGIAGWLDNMLAVAFEQTLVEPNMLVVDVESLLRLRQTDFFGLGSNFVTILESWFTVDEKAPLAHVKLEIIEAADLKPSDLNGFSDPYVKGHLGQYRFRTKIQKKTLSPKWLEEFKIPITSWEEPNLLVLELRDKDHIFDDVLGDCAVNINELRGGRRHDMWLPLLNIKIGRIRLAITVLEGEDDKVKVEGLNGDKYNKANETVSPRSNLTSQNQNPEEVNEESQHHMVDQFEPIDMEGQDKTGVWVHRPGSDVSQSWEPRKGRARRPEMKLQCESNEGPDSPKSTGSGSNNSESNDKDGTKVRRVSTIKRGFHKIGSVFHSSAKDGSPRKDGDEYLLPTPRPNIHAVGEKGTSIRVIYEDCGNVSPRDAKLNKDGSSPDKGEGVNPKKGQVKGIAKNIIKQAGKSAHSLKSVLSRKGAGSFSLGEDQEPEMEVKEESSMADSSSFHKKESTILEEGYKKPSPDTVENPEKSVRLDENIEVGKFENH